MENDIIVGQTQTIQRDSLNISLHRSFSRETATQTQTEKYSAVDIEEVFENYTDQCINQDENLDANAGTSGPCCSYSCVRKSSQIIEPSYDYDKPSDNELNDDLTSLQSNESYVCRICHNNENPERLVSPCLCKGTLTYVHTHCLERWISTSRCTTCELCQFQYNTHQILRYSMFESLRIWYSRSLSRHALQEDCQMFSLLTLVAFGIIATLLVAVQYYIVQGRITGTGRVWTKGWLIFFLTTTLIVYFVNVYMIAKSQFTPWYRWWQSARDIHLMLENRRPFRLHNLKEHEHQQELQQQQHLELEQQHHLELEQQQHQYQLNHTITYQQQQIQQIQLLQHQQQQQQQQQQQLSQNTVAKLGENYEQNLQTAGERRRESTTVNLPLIINQQSTILHSTNRSGFTDNWKRKKQTIMATYFIKFKKLNDMLI